jgi:hypothetical protein
MKPLLVSSSYGNYVSDEGEAIAREAYGSNYDRLVALKNQYDPTNFFITTSNQRSNLRQAARNLPISARHKSQYPDRLT